MSFSVTTRLPLYVSATGITLRITAAGSATRVNGVADDAMSDNADGLFVASVAEDLTGTHEYVIYRSGTPIQSGWLKRIADQASVILDDPRDFAGDESVGLYPITVSVIDDNEDPVSGAAVWIEGTAKVKHTNSSGIATLYAEPGECTVICETPAGYTDADPIEVDVTAEGPNEADFTVVTSFVDPLPAPLCNVTLPTVNQFGSPQSGVAVTIKFVQFNEGAVPTGVIVNTQPGAKSNKQGNYLTPLLRLARYTASYQIGSERPKEITFDVPDAGSYLVTES
jgi:hypothetical protein